MDTSQPLPFKQSSIRWKRVVVAAFCSEMVVIVVLSAIITIHRFVVVPGQPDAQYQEFGELAGYYVAAPAAALGTFACAWLATRRLKSAHVINGLLIGIFATVLTLGFLVAAKPEHRLMYIISYIARIAGGYVAGLVARNKQAA